MRILNSPINVPFTSVPLELQWIREYKQRLSIANTILIWFRFYIRIASQSYNRYHCIFLRRDHVALQKDMAMVGQKYSF